MSKSKKAITLELVLPWMLIVGGAIGLISSFILSLDKLKLLENPNFRPNCDLNPVVSCVSVMNSWQASVFGFPNTWIGLAGFAAITSIGAAILAGATIKRWFWLVLELGITLNFIFAYWMLYESVYKIKALCPYCLTVDIVITILFWYTTLYVFEKGFLRLPKSWGRAFAFARRHHFDILVVWFLITIVIILKHFWYYYSTLL